VTDRPPPPPASRTIASQAKANRSTRDHWTWFASHRAQIQSLILPDVRARATAAPRLCVLGAGNCNDTDLKVLTAEFAEVHLVDIDGAALAQAVRRQGAESSRALHLHGGVDLTGIADLLPRWERSPPSPAEVDTAARRASEAPVPPIGGPFDVVLSPCLLSQLVGYASDVLGRSHARWRDLLLALRTRHLRTLVDLLRPGGTAVIACDVASSTGHPALLDMRREKLPDFLDRLTYTDRGFDGLSPPAMQAALHSDPLIAPLLAPVQQIPPWLWRLGPQRTFLVYALRLRRLPGPVVLDGASPLSPALGGEGQGERPLLD
jgi:hypothetical protein